MKINNQTKLNAVIGFPLQHSLSPILHNFLYESIGENAVLLAFSHENVEALVDSIRTLPIHLTAVTIPHKQAVIPFLDEVDGLARELQSVNTIIQRDGKLFGYNTDLIGLKKALAGVKIKNKKVLLIGAGGVAIPAAYLISQCGGLAYYLNRTKENAEKLQLRFGGNVAEEKKLNEMEIDIIINTTPVGMYPKIGEMPVSARLLARHQTVFDIVYNPLKTKLLTEAEKVGAKIISGMEMFIYQGVEQVKLWTGKDIDGLVIKKAREELLSFKN